ncbi:branched-chain amino acid ABC transporter permease [Pseudonocardia kujensis]|uniref:branched-chain amino acid ABC transporter permease n=1 Tax=Pseudonocardia kujensis TaxID=1128675 RepID=UPI001E52C1E6|nr:branched-chain amino acid ABC transporter permease [Pseudonocardia kujensis]MCE0767618.1 branched-chain amino acid ABC transporter permease [Pseudonocardia kujensis]
MELLLGGLISGLVSGLLYSLLGFATIILYKCTGVANFAVGVLATVAVFAAYRTIDLVGFRVAIVLALVAAALLGAAVYAIAIRPRSDAGHLNLTIRTFGILLVVLAVLNATWANGQPFTFPSIFSTSNALTLGGVAIAWNTIGALCVGLVLVAIFLVVFRSTGVGLLFIATASDPEVARILGVRTGRLALLAWAMSSVVAACVGLLVAPTSLLSSDMLDPYLLIGFSAAAVGGLSSLYGVFVAGLVIGVVGNVSSLYLTPDVGTMIVFAVLLATLSVRPWGLFGRASIQRL